METKTINFAVIGAGGFAHFAVNEFVKQQGVNFIGVVDPVQENCERFRSINATLKIYKHVDEVYHDTSVDLVYIATPPYLHYAQSKAALLSGKHVICEKPAALRTAEAEELKSLADKNDLLYVVNLMQRYNPLFDSVKSIIDNNILGEFLHGFFENYASDEFLGESHWFWDEEKSGGIFIEHGVHFFDLFAGWLGEGNVIFSTKLKRNGSGVADRVQATVMFSSGLVNFYHGFDQPKVLDRQEMRLQFERGEITLFEWVPTRMVMNAICSHPQLETFWRTFPGAAITFVEQHKHPKLARARFKEISYDTKIQLDTGETASKETVYRDLLSRMLKDQILWLRNRSHVRKIDGQNAIDSLKVAVEADRLAEK